MKAFLKIVVWGTLAFIAVAVVQERTVFLAALGFVEQPDAGLSAAEEASAVETVERFLSLMTHCYGSGGDPRFLERLPASADVADEIRRDVVYLQHNRRVQVPALMRFEVTATEPRGEGRAIVRTREYWIVRTELLGEPGGVESVDSMVVGGSYMLVRSGASWQVVGWEVEELAESGSPAGEPRKADR